ncbi:MAG: S9 family peptidase [Rhodocyclaceae bacterium]|nr:S9 family peptidase [Rhodocyclaceae bacterium]
MHTITRCRWVAALAASIALFMTSPIGAVAQTAKGTAAEGALDKFLDPASADLATKLEVLQHAIYLQETRLLVVAFRLEYGDRIRMREVSFPASDKTLVPGYIFTPLKLDKGRRLPCIILVHGGYHERLDPKYFPMIEVAINQGYTVMFPEYRGSRGYGANHYVNDYGVTDTADVLASAAYMAKQDYVDADRMVIFGQSRGGMITLSSIQKEPKRFKAAVDVVGLTDMVAFMSYKPDWRRRATAKDSSLFKGKLPDENLAAYMEISPLNNVDAIQTPLLVMATTGDKIAPLTLHTGRLIDALKARGKNHEVKIYENAPGGHVFLMGDSDEAEDAIKRMFDFIGRYLKK